MKAKKSNTARVGYIQIECPAHVVNYKDFEVAERFRDDWNKWKLWDYVSNVKELTLRAPFF